MWVCAYVWIVSVARLQGGAHNGRVFNFLSADNNYDTKVHGAKKRRFAGKHITQAQSALMYIGKHRQTWHEHKHKLQIKRTLKPEANERTHTHTHTQIYRQAQTQTNCMRKHSCTKRQNISMRVCVGADAQEKQLLKIRLI